MVDAYPIQWPSGWQRTEPYNREHSRFKTTFSNARHGILNEIRLLGGNNPIISSNIPTRLDGLPYANFKSPEDPGVVIYFMLDGHEECIPCDRWRDAGDNLHAIELCIGAMRGMDRWGAKDMVKASFRGFEALPPHSDDNPDTVFAKHGVDYFAGCETKQDIKERRRNLSLDLHPDKKGGDASEFTEMMKQYDQMLKEAKKNR